MMLIGWEWERGRGQEGEWGHFFFQDKLDKMQKQEVLWEADTKF